MASQQWDARLRELGGHLLQSWEWGAFKQRAGWTPERIAIDTGDGTAMAQVLFRSKGPLSIGYIPRGPVLSGDIQAAWERLRDAIDRVARRRRAVSVIIEPNGETLHEVARDERRLGPAHVRIQPARTVKVPLLDDEALLAQMHHKTRYNIRRAPRRGVRFEILEPTPVNLRAFYDLLLETAQRNQFNIHTPEYYAGVLEALGDNAALIGAWTDERELAAALIVARFGDEAIYLYGASSTEHRANGAGVAIQFEAMRWARARGASVYDLWGIPAEDPEPDRSRASACNAGTCGKDWSGLYRFKTGFGGEIVSYPEPVERGYLPVLPWLARRLGYISG